MAVVHISACTPDTSSDESLCLHTLRSHHTMLCGKDRSYVDLHVLLLSDVTMALVCLNARQSQVAATQDVA